MAKLMMTQCYGGECIQMHLHTGRRTTLMRSGHQERNLRTRYVAVLWSACTEWVLVPNIHSAHSVKKSVQVIPENHIGDLAASSISGKQNTVAAAALIAAGVGAGALAVNKLFGAGSRPYEANVGNEYDAWTSEGILEYFWGEHIHLGYYSKEELAKGWKKKDFIEAKYDFIEEMFKWSGSTAPKKILDVGCGIGGTSRYLAKRFPDAEVIGITISAKQVERATQLAKEQGVGNVQFQLVDALDMSFEDNQFDLVWGCESGEHMPDKKKYVEEMTRVLAPNGHLAIATWCQRHATPDNPLNDKEKEELQFLYDEWAHPYFISIKDYEDILQDGDAESADRFIQDVLDGKVKKFLKSAKPPMENDEPVKVVVGTTLESFVKSGKHVLLEVYAPWCGHCKALEPVYKEAALELAAYDDIVFAKLDGTENDIDHDGISVQGYPSIFYIAPDGSVESYNGGRTENDLTDFMLKKADKEPTAEATEEEEDEDEDVKYEL